MGRLYFVSITVEADLTIPVEADSESEAEEIAEKSYDIHDLEFDTFSHAKMVEKCPEWAKNEIAEGSGGKTCPEVLDGEDYREQRMREMEESWPKLPGFSDPVPSF